ncbi:hypothetical protein [Streptomyces sp. 142MFCol3.1]|uniref:hypothetical protein n=1 Tax=Streptomyces sp. 142MFCol3.1 TaxID=1172179 RepID=UPI00048BB006|nr:hypothetical protein [Streptomyces sp. 142MFCol3.1]
MSASRPVRPEGTPCGAPGRQDGVRVARAAAKEAQPPRLHGDGSVTVGRRVWDVDAAGWPEDEIELRAYGNGHYLGRFMLTPGPREVRPLQARLVAVTLADQTGAALDTSGLVHR